ncbi:hypothetical protein Mapa_011049 [Marchantia paleacea]|nr:hypothetical protein Mapa_011049 [Marchantia paleacea]
MTEIKRCANTVRFQLNLQVSSKIAASHREWNCNLRECSLMKNRIPMSIVENKLQTGAD